MRIKGVRVIDWNIREIRGYGQFAEKEINAVIAQITSDGDVVVSIETVAGQAHPQTVIMYGEED